jgi:hypothetical protein
VKPIAESDIRRPITNWSRSEAANMVLPKDLAALGWDSVD